MKKMITNISKQVLFLVSSLLLSFLSFAQDKKVDVDINTKGDSSNVFAQPWVWVVGVAVFIIIIVALLRGKKD